MDNCSKEFYDVMDAFERSYPGNRFDKESKDLFRLKRYYQDGQVNLLF